MRLTQRIAQSPDGTAYPNATVRVRRWSDSVTIATLTSDDDGFIDWTYDGHPEPFYLHLSDIPGGDKYWSSKDAMTVGAVALADVPVALRALGDGVIRTVTSELVVSLVAGGPSVTVAPGAANVAGHPFATYADTALTIARPDSGTRVDRIVIRLNPEGSATTPGQALLAVLAGTVDAGTPALTQTATTYEVSLAQVSVPAAGAVVLTDERAYSGEKLDVADVAQDDTITTTSAGGAALGDLSITLLLPRTATYDIAAEASARQTNTAATSAWALQATYGPTFNGLALSFPAQVAVDSTGRVLIADSGHDRLVILTSAGAYATGITGLTNITGVCVDSSNNIYTLSDGGTDMRLRKYSSALVLQWSVDFGGNGGQGHVTTDGTHVWACDSVNRRVSKRLCADGTGGVSVGTAGSGNGQFGSGGPYGIANDGTSLYVTDPGNLRVQVFTTAGVYVTQWAYSAVAIRGVALDAAGNVLVADNEIAVERTTNTGTFIDHFAQTQANGIGVATGDVLWVSNALDGTIAKWDEATTPGGYGQIAIEIDAVVGTYSGIGLRDGALSVVETGTKVGPGTVVVRAFGKATASTMTLASAVLSARAVPRS